MFRPLSQTKFINDANLVSYWKLDGNSNDSKGSNNGTDTSMSYSAGQFDSAGVFNGTNSQIYSQSASFDFNGTQALSYSLWINTTLPTSTKFYNIIMIQEGTNTDTYDKGIKLSSSGEIGMYAYDGAAKYGKTSTSVISSGNWYHIVGTYDGTNLKTYVNGVLLATLACSSTYNFTNPRFIFSHKSASDAPGIFYAGSIDDTAIFSRALSAGEVAELYQSQTLGEYLPNSNTKLLLHLNGSSADSSGNNNNGTDTAITYSQANGKFGQGAGFNGSSSRIETGVTGLPSGAGARTLSFWFKIPTLPTNNGANYIGIWYGEHSNTTNKNCFLSIGQASGATNVGMGFWSNDLFISTPFSINIWYLLTGTYDGTTVKLYLNGNLVGSGAKSSVSTSTVISRIGNTYANIESNFFNGSIDEVIIESVALTPQQVQKYYTMTKGRFGII